MPLSTSISNVLKKHGPEPVLHINSYIFVSSTFGKGKALFYLLTKITTTRAGEFFRLPFFLKAEE